MGPCCSQTIYTSLSCALSIQNIRDLKILDSISNNQCLFFVRYKEKHNETCTSLGQESQKLGHLSLNAVRTFFQKVQVSNGMLFLIVITTVTHNIHH